MDKNQLVEAILNLPPDELAKAVKDAKGLEGIRIIKDLWEDYHALPARDDTKTGPAMHSSGSGADKAMHEYSNPAPQVGLTEAYKEFTDKNIEGWGKMHSAFKSLGDDIVNAIKGLKKAEEEEKKEEHKEPEMKSPDPDPDPECKSPDPEPDPDPKAKSAFATKLASAWEELTELLTAFAKAEESEHDEKKDVEGLEEARHHIEKAEKELEAVESHEKKEAEKQAMKAQVSLNLAWRSLMKATGLSSYDLHGYGNQEDAQVPGDSTKDQSKKDLKAAKAKAEFYTLKTKALEKRLGIKSETPAEEKKEEHKEAEAKSPDPDPDPDPKAKADISALQNELAKQQDFMKATNERVAELNKRIGSVTGHTMPPMTPVMVKSVGLKSDQVAKSLQDRIEMSMDAGELDDEQAGIARSLVDRYLAAGKGQISVDIVNQQLGRAPQEVQSFFSGLENVA